MKKLLTALVFMSATVAHAQSIGIGTSSPNAKAALDITAADKGLLIPRMDSVTRVAITSPPDGLMVFQTFCQNIETYFLLKVSRIFLLKKF